MKKWFLTFFCLIRIAYGQTQLPSIVPPSPQSTDFLKYGDYPVDYNTGIPDISIPLYTISSGDLEMPIVLRYHSAGIKPLVADPSNIGAGWTLDVGGIVSRTIMGRADELYNKAYPFKGTVQLSNQEDPNNIAFLNDLIASKDRDSQHDMFSYMFDGKYGQFAIDNNGTNTFTAYPYPFVPYKFSIPTIVNSNSSYYQTIQGIDITDDEGKKYQFGHTYTDIANIEQDYATTTWYLENVSNAANTNQISMSYLSGPVVSSGGGDPMNFNIGPDQGINVGNSPNVIAPNTQAASQTGTTSISNGAGISYNIKIIDAIHFKNGYVKFNYDNSQLHINSIVVYNNNGIVIRSYVFNRDLFPGSNYFNRLNSLQVTDANSNTVQQYGFTYYYVNDTNGNPIQDDECNLDRWGYCQGPGTFERIAYRTIDIVDPQSTGNPNGYINNVQVGNGDFTPNTTYAQRFVLQKIQYPTGGTTQFTFEGNVYTDGGQTLPGGGLRIKQILSTDNLGGTITKNYTYDPGFVEYSLSNVLNFVHTTFNAIIQYERPDLLNPPPIFYQYRNRTYNNEINSGLGDNHVYYTGITEYTGDGLNSGKNVYTYTYDNPNDIGSNQLYNAAIVDYRNWGNGLLHEKQVFKNTGNNTYFKIKDMTNNYTFVITQTLNDFFASMLCTYTDYYGDNYTTPGTVHDFRDEILSNNQNTTSLPYPCTMYNYTIHTGAYYLSSTLENDYADNGGVMTITANYLHNNPLNYYTTEEDVTKSDGSTGVTDYAYPQDLTDATSTAMATANILAPVIVKKVSRSAGGTTTLLNTTQTTYAQFGSIFAPGTVSFSTGSNAPEARLQFNKYDIYGNTLEQQKTGGPKNAYQWGYNSEYPVAVAANAGSNDIFFDSFEEGDGTSTAGNAHTGHYSYLGSPAYTKMLSGLTGGSYILSYWLKSASTGLWSLVSGNVTGVGTSYTITIAAGNQIDDVRFYPAAAQMTTYTYDPLVGMTSVTDAKGKVTYYLYDTFQRLQNITDQNGNVIKHFTYHYQGH